MVMAGLVVMLAGLFWPRWPVFGRDRVLQKAVPSDEKPSSNDGRLRGRPHHGGHRRCALRRLGFGLRL
jgi:hypothetical protein